MRYTLKQIHCRPWALNGLSLKLIESHLREAGFDEKYMYSGHSGWKAIGAPTKLHT